MRMECECDEMKMDQSSSLSERKKRWILSKEWRSVFAVYAGLYETENERKERKREKRR